MAFAQLTYRESLRDIECCLRAMKQKLYHMGIKENQKQNQKGQVFILHRLEHSVKNEDLTPRS
jgi:hypothetical protein